MGRRKPRARFHASGVLVAAKPAGPTSHDVVDRLRRRFRPGKLGHAGTLDPFATGVLVLVFNHATRLADLLGAGDKTYRARLRLGQATDTGDHTGQVTATAPVPELSQDQARAALAAMVGQRMQSPPAYSAAKHQGRPLYAYAREGTAVDKPARPITIYEASLLGLAPGVVEFELKCSRGTYVRTLGEELARALGSEGHLAALCRTASAPFSLERAVDPDEAAQWSDEELAARLAPPERALARCGLPAVELDDDKVWALRQGQILPPAELGAGQGPWRGAFMALDGGGGLVAVLRWLEPGERRPGRDYETIRVFPEALAEHSEKRASASAVQAE